MRKTILFLSFFVAITILISIICMVAYADTQYCFDITKPSNISINQNVTCATTNTYTNFLYSNTENYVQVSIGGVSGSGVVPCIAYVGWDRGTKEKWYHTYNYVTVTDLQDNWTNGNFNALVRVSTSAAYVKDRGKHLETMASNDDNDVCKHRIRTGSSA